MPLSPPIEPHLNTMNIHINQQPFVLPDAATVTDALAAFGAKPPFAVALNGAVRGARRNMRRRRSAG